LYLGTKYSFFLRKLAFRDWEHKVNQEIEPEFTCYKVGRISSPAESCFGRIGAGFSGAEKKARSAGALRAMGYG
jgi:hypothetical protein